MTKGYNLAHWLSTLASPSHAHWGCTEVPLHGPTLSSTALNGSVAPLPLLLTGFQLGMGMINR